MNDDGSSRNQFIDIAIPTTEDVVDYRIYFEPPLGSVSAYKLRLEEISQFLQENLVKDYIWQEEPFSLTLVEGLESSSLEPAIPLAADAPASAICHYYGSTRFGDNIEDEWFIVHLLQELSKRYKEMCIRYERSICLLPLL